jgi:AcrR family transcriptional regulator
MTAAVGRREASKQATRAALRAAAKQLFADRGFEATTVRDIATAAKVTERTFYRYFDGKEGLLAGEFAAWLATVQEAIAARPAAEPPWAAVRQVMLSVARQASAGAGPAPLWPLADRPPLSGLRQAAPRPLLRFEASIASAVLARLRAGSAGGSPADPGQEYQAQVIGRVAVAAFRSAVIRYRELAARGEAGSHGIGRLLEQAFAIIDDGYS